VTLRSAFGFADEMRVGLRGMVRRVWGKRGVKVRQRLQISYEWRCLFLAVDSQAGQLFWCWLPALTAIDVRNAIRGLQPFGLAALFWDRAATHHDQGSRDLGLPLVEQPSASPELNPAEQVVEELRRAVEGKVDAAIDDEVVAVEAELERLDADPDRVRRLTGWGWTTATIQHLRSVRAT
jgi:hypothetical protein